MLRKHIKPLYFRQVPACTPAPILSIDFSFFSNRTFSILCCVCQAVTNVRCRQSPAGRAFPGKALLGGGSSRAPGGTAREGKSTTHLSGGCMTIVEAGKANSAEINEVPSVKRRTVLEFPPSLPSRSSPRVRADAGSTLLRGETGKAERTLLWNFIENWVVKVPWWEPRAAGGRRLSWAATHPQPRSPPPARPRGAAPEPQPRAPAEPLRDCGNHGEPGNPLWASASFWGWLQTLLLDVSKRVIDSNIRLLIAWQNSSDSVLQLPHR